jgi:uncharacterized protein YciI
MFAIILEYKSPPKDVPGLVDAHKAWANANVANGTFILSGPNKQGNGGLILAHGIDRATLDALIDTDPFKQADVVTYTIIEAAPRTGDPRLAFLLAG